MKTYEFPMAYERKDHFYRQAKREGKASRAAYKLTELQSRFKIIKKGDSVLDLGCAPGGWLQEIAKIIGKGGRVVGVDILPIKISLPEVCTFIRGDVRDKATLEEISRVFRGKADVIVSDMSPNLSGIQFADTYRSYELAGLALEICRDVLRDGGNFMTKLFPGEEFTKYTTELKQHFSRVAIFVPKATRKASSERYLVGLGYKDAYKKTRGAS